MISLNLGKDLYLKGRIGWRGLSKDEYLKHSDYRIINATALMDGFVDWNKCGFISKERYDESEEISLQENDILISKDGTIGKIGYVKNMVGPCTVASGIFVLRNLETSNVNFDYLYHILKSSIFKDFIHRNKAQGSTISHLYQRDLEGFELELPELDEQAKVAGILNSIDAQIKRNNEMVQKLQVLSQTIFNNFFSDETEMVSLIDFPYAKILKPGISKFEGQKHYIATAEVEGDKVNFDAPLIDYETRENRANMQPVKNSVWFAKLKNSVKHLHIPKEDSLLLSNYILSTGFCGLECEDIAFEYMINYINLPYFENKKNILSHGATMEGVNNDNLKSMHIHLPSKERLIAFHRKTKNIHCQITKINEKTFELTKLKEKLLPLLINGQLE